MAAIPCAVGSIAIKHSEASATGNRGEVHFSRTLCKDCESYCVYNLWDNIADCIAPLKISRIKSILKDDDDFNLTKPT